MTLSRFFPCSCCRRDRVKLKFIVHLATKPGSTTMSTDRLMIAQASTNVVFSHGSVIARGGYLPRNAPQESTNDRHHGK
jgi:hypothetical protein